MSPQTAYRLRRESDNRIVASRLEIAQTFVQRTCGLMFRKTMLPDSALLIRPGGSIHTCFMRFSIDVAYADEDLLVTGIAVAVKPWRVSLAPAGTRLVVEMPAHSIQAHRIHIGDRLLPERIDH